MGALSAPTRHNPREGQTLVGSAALQGSYWGAAAQDWATLQERFALPLWLAMLDAAWVGSGTRFLDAGCGAGGASVVAARRGAQVNGLDAAEPLVRIARQRVPDGDFLVGDLEKLPYVDHAFHAIIAADVLEYAADPIAALNELHRVCVPGGRIVVATWAMSGWCETRAVFQAIMAALPSPPPAGWPSAHPATGALARAIERAGMRVAGSDDIACICTYPDIEAAWRAQRATGPLQAALQVVDEPALARIVSRALSPYRETTGVISLEKRFHYVTALA